MKLNELKKLIRELTIAELNRRPSKINEDVSSFFTSTKHGVFIDKMLKGQWNRRKVQWYFNNIYNDNTWKSVVKWRQLIESLANQLGITARKYTKWTELEDAVLDKMEILYSLR